MAITLDGTTGATVPAVSDSGNLTFTGTGNRITGDFSTAPIANRVMFQNSITNSNSNVSVIPNGTSTISAFRGYGASDPTNAPSVSLAQIGTTESRLNSEINGTASYTPMTFYTSGSEQMRIDTSGIVTGTAGNLMLVQNASRITLASTATVISTTIPSWVKRIVLNIVGMTTSGTSGYIVQIGSGSYTSTGYLGSGSVVATSGATTAFTTGFGMHNNNGATTVSHVTMTLNLQNAATNTWSESHTGAYSNLAVTMFGGGSVSLGGVLNQLRITTVNGTDTFTAGTINFQYE